MVKPHGSAVKCSKCGKVFRAYPTGTPIDPKSNRTGAGAERRRDPRIPVTIPALCNVADPHGNPMDLALIKDISKGGIALELFPNTVSEVVSVFLICADTQNLKINGRVVHSIINCAGKMKVRLCLLGNRGDIRFFVAKAAESYRLNLMQTVKAGSGNRPDR